jgi:hypothetical protein
MHERVKQESDDDGKKNNGKSQRSRDMEKFTELVKCNQKVRNWPDEKLVPDIG